MLNPLLNSEQREWYKMLCRSLHSYQPYEKREQNNQCGDKSQKDTGFDLDKGLDGKLK